MKNIFYINLDERDDRRKSCESQFKKLGWSFKRFSAIKHENGAIGCAKSHLKILEQAKKEKLDYVIIFEDDFIIKDFDKLKTIIKNIIKEKTYFDVLKLGGNPYPPYKKITKNYVQLTYSQTTHAYMVLNHYYDTLIKNYKESIILLTNYGIGPSGIFACDVWQNLLINKFNHRWLIINPLLISQKQDYSNIEKKDINYEWYCLHFKNTNKTLRTFYCNFSKSKQKLLLKNYYTVNHLINKIK